MATARLRTQFPRRNKPWTEAEDHQVKAQYEAVGPAVLSKRMGRSPVSIQARALAMGLSTPRRPQGEWATHYDTELKRLVDAGRSVNEIANQLNLSARTVVNHAEMLGIKIPGQRASSRTRAPWTANELKTLRTKYPKGGAIACLPNLPNRTQTAIRVKAKALNIRYYTVESKPTRWTKAKDKLLRQHHGEGASRSVIARLLDVTLSEASERAIHLGLRARPRDVPFVFDAATDRRLRELHAEGLSTNKIVIALQVNRPAVCKRMRQLQLTHNKGGARPGAGRPIADIQRAVMTLRIDERYKAWLSAQIAGDSSRTLGELVEQALEAHFHVLQDSGDASGEEETA